MAPRQPTPSTGPAAEAPPPAPSGERRLLLVDDDEWFCQSLAQELRDRGYEARCAFSGPQALEELEWASYPVVAADLRMPGMDGLELLREVRERFPGVSVIILTGHGSVESAVQAMKQGAADYVEKPFVPDEFLLAIEKVFGQRRLLDELAELRDELGHRYRFDQMVSRDPAMRDVFATIARVAATDATVLITGETGTGKEMVARAIHYHSPRRRRRFLALNCAALPNTLLESELFGHERGAFTGATRQKPGLLEAADGGTLLLDEIGSVSPAMQGKLLRVLETMEYTRVGGLATRHCNVRFLAATHADLPAAVGRGGFRADLFYRINVVPVHLPPLRERTADIPLLVDHFVRLHGPSLNPDVRDVAPEALRHLVRCPWPGNVRELEHVVQRALIHAEGHAILPEHLPPCPEEPLDETPIPCDERLPLKDVKARLIERLERTYLDKVLRLCHGNVRRAAQHAGLSERSMHTKLRRYEIDRRQYT